MAELFSGDVMLDIDLPAGFELRKINQYISELKLFITSPLVQSLILAHPNEVAIQGTLSLSSDNTVDDWWSWAAHLDTQHQGEVTSLLIDSATTVSMPAGMFASFYIYKL